MAKSAIYLLNDSTLEVKDGAFIPFGDIVRRYGQNIRQDGEAVVLCDKCTGYYKVDIVATMEPAVAADYKVVLEKDGVPVKGGISELDGFPALSIAPFIISVIVKNSCSGASNLAVRLEGGDAKVINMTTVVERL